MAAGLRDVLALQGVIPVSEPSSTGGLRDVLAAQGVVPISAVPSGAAAAGFITHLQMSGVWITGSLQEAVSVTPTPNTDGGGRGAGPIYRGKPRVGYEQAQVSALEETRRKRILAEDDDMIALITAMVTKRLI